MDIQAYIQSGIIETYVLGLASAEEAIELETLQLQYPEVGEAVGEFSQLIEQEMMRNAIAPPAGVKEKIMAAIRSEQGVTPVVALPHDAEKTVSSKAFNTWRMLAAASVILFFVSAGLNFYLYNQYNQKNSAYQALLTERNSLQANNQIFQTRLQEWQKITQVITDPAMTVVKMPGTPGKEQNLATVYWNTKNKAVYVVANKLPRPPKGKQFQLWALVNGKPVDAGMLDPACEGVCRAKDITTAQAFAITLEKEGGSPTPTMQQLYVLGKI